MKNALFELSKILRTVTESGSASDQVKMIVDAIASSMAVDICSLYIPDEHSDMVLVANHGISPERVAGIKLPAGVGLVGLTAKSLHPVNIADALHHEANYFIPGIDDGDFVSFCGVPLVRSGKVIGVLVVQSSQRRQFSAEDEAFLVTLASQLALLQIELPELSAPAKFKRIIGIKGSPGVAIGKIYSIGLDNIARSFEVILATPEQTIQRWRSLLQEVQRSFAEDKSKLNGSIEGDVSSIFDTYSMLISDPAFAAFIEQRIQGGAGIVAAIKAAVEHFSNFFANCDDAYLRSRQEDIVHLGRKLVATLAAESPNGNLHAEDAIVLVGKHISVSDIADAMEGNLVGIISGDGSSLSHSAVLANALGIPAVMGVNDLKLLYDGDLTIVDGNSGAFIARPTRQLIREYKKLINQQKATTEKLASLRHLPAETLDGIHCNLYTNTGLLADIAPGLQNGAEGVGLYRTEIPFMVHDTFPSEDEQFAIYRQIINAYETKPVYMRVLDVGSDKQLPYYPIADEENPAMGWRGIRFALDNSSLLMSQLRAMLRASIGSDNLHVLIPMITTYEELVNFHQLLDEACRQINHEYAEVKKPKVGVMVEVPVAISQLRHWAAMIDFISIGSNDLSQYLLATDRNNARVAARYDSVHPGVISEIQRIVKEAEKMDLPVCLCGEMATDPVSVILLLGSGIRTLSMSAMKLPYIKSLIRQVSLKECKRVVAKTTRMQSAVEIRQYVANYLDKLQLTTPIR